MTDPARPQPMSFASQFVEPDVSQPGSHAAHWARLERLAPWLLAALLLGLLGLATVVARGLYADGGLFCLLLLKSGHVISFDPTRQFAQLLMQAPALLALWSGVGDRMLLLRIYSLGLCAAPALLWMGALLVARRGAAFWPLLALFCVVYFNSAFFAIGEYNVAYAATALVAMLLLHPRPLGWLALAVLWAAILLLVASYEAMAFLAPLLGAILLLRAWRLRPLPRRETIGLTLAALGLAAGAAVAWRGLLFPRVPDNYHGARDLSVAFKHHQFLLSAAVAGLYLLSHGPRASAQGRLLRAALCPAALLLWWPRMWIGPAAHYELRSVAGLALLAGLTLLALRSAWPLPSPATQVADSAAPGEPAGSPPLTHWLVPCLMFIGLFGSNLNHTLGYGRFLRAFDHELRTRGGLVPYETTGLTNRKLGPIYGWGWAYPTLSVLLRDSGTGTLILSPTDWHGWTPFDPRRNPPPLPPHLSKHGPPWLPFSTPRQGP